MITESSTGTPVSPYIIHSADYIFLSANQKLITGLDSFSNQRLYIWLCLDNTSLCIDYAVETFKITVFLFGSILPKLEGH